MTDAPKVLGNIHLIDSTLGPPFRTAACGAADGMGKHEDTFEQAIPEFRCKTCEQELAASKKYQRKCRLCGETFESPQEMAEHESRNHVLTVVSFRKQRLCFLLDLQTCYDSSSSKALRIMRARQELKLCASGSYDFIPGRLMLKREGENSVILGEGYVAEYIVIPR